MVSCEFPASLGSLFGRTSDLGIYEHTCARIREATRERLCFCDQQKKKEDKVSHWMKCMCLIIRPLFEYICISPQGFQMLRYSTICFTGERNFGSQLCENRNGDDNNLTVDDKKKSSSEGETRGT